MKPRLTRKEKKLTEIAERMENIEKVIVSILLRLEKMEGVEEKK